MTHEELIEKAAKDIKHYYGNEFDVVCAKRCIATILTALQEPTEEMIIAGGNYVLSVGSIDCMHVDDRPEFGMKGRETGSYELFKAMLAASPLAPEKTNERT